jgi:hypothetical protein
MLWWIVHKQMNMMVYAVHFDKWTLEVQTDLRKDGRPPINF